MLTPQRLTKEEKAAIAALKRLEKKWPKTLWLYSASGTLHVMRCSDDGTIAITGQGGMDADASVDIIKIPNGGGDW